MTLDNYRDVSAATTDVGAGFQFEFSCALCNKRWKSPFKPYRMGQFTGLLSMFGFVTGNLTRAARGSAGAAEFRSRGAREKALAEAQVLARQRYTSCNECQRTVCNSCFDTSAEMCEGCVAERQKGGAGGHAGASGAGAHACPNCNTASSGGRFCAECGFDMASTHKSCPGCGALAERQARFCGDCGHGF